MQIKCKQKGVVSETSFTNILHSVIDLINVTPCYMKPGAILLREELHCD